MGPAELGPRSAGSLLNTFSGLKEARLSSGNPFYFLGFWAPSILPLSPKSRIKVFSQAQTMAYKIWQPYMALYPPLQEPFKGGLLNSRGGDAAGEGAGPSGDQPDPPEVQGSLFAP